MVYLCIEPEDKDLSSNIAMKLSNNAVSIEQMSQKGSVKIPPTL